MLSASAVDNKIKILFVFPGGTKDRDQVFIKSFDQLHKTFPDLQDLKKVIGLVITQANDYFSGTDLLKQLDSDNMNTELKEFIHYFMTHEDQVFCFSEALPQNINQNYDFEDHDKLMYFLLNNYKKNPDYRIAISKDVEREIDIEIFKHLESIKAITSKFSDMLSSQYNKENDSSSIKSWLEKMKNLANIEIKTPNGFKNAVQKNLADYEIYDDCIELLIESMKQGKFKNDQIMNISGSTSFTLLSLDDNNTIQSHGSLTNKCIGTRNSTVKYCGKEDHWMKTQDISFDASKSVRTGDRVMPRTIFENLYVYIGS